MREFLSRISRRGFLKIFGSAVAVSPLARGVLAQESSAVDEAPGEASLIRIMQLLFPHQDIDSQIFTDMAEHVSAVAGRSADNGALLSNGLAELDGLSNGDWLGSAENEQLLALEKIADTPAFGFIRINALEYLYRDPRAWELVGYEGSALEHGGYVNRGFNDIDWLPES